MMTERAPTINNFIAIEGGDGAGKGTQAEMLTESLRRRYGFKVLKQSYPQYGEPSAYYAEQYLNGRFGAANDVPADLAALAFAVDRAGNQHLLTESISQPGHIGLADRYVASNCAHQGTKIADPAERAAFYERTLHTEHAALGNPEPQVNFLMLVPPELAQANVDKKAARSYTTLKRDVHEADSNHLALANANYRELAELYPEKFTAIQVMNEHGEMRSREDIQDELIGHIEQMVADGRLVTK